MIAAARITLAALAIPAAALVLPPVAQAAPCPQYHFAGLQILNQSNGYRLEFFADGPTVNADVTSFNNQQAIANHGNVGGEIDGRAVWLTARWDDGTVGEYTGSVSSNGKVRGQTSGGGGSANWNLRNALVCAE